MQIPKDIRSAVNKALYRLSMGDLTCGEMMVYLTDPRRKNTAFPPDVAERTVAFLSQEGLLDDKRYLKLLVRKMDEALFGLGKIRETLIRHRFPPRFVEAALARKIDYGARACALLQKRSTTPALLQTQPGRKKLMDYLVRQGYDYSTARSAVDSCSEWDSFSEESSFSD